MSKVTMDMIRTIEWGKSYLWDFTIDDPYFPLDWVPAVDIEVSNATVESHSIEAGQKTYKIPNKSAPIEIKLTFIDSIKCDVFAFFEKWMSTNTINQDEYVSTIESCSKLVQVKRLDNDRETVNSMSSFWVYPEGTLSFNGNSESGTPMYSINLVVVGSISENGLTKLKKSSASLSIERTNFSVKEAIARLFGSNENETTA